MDGFAPSFGRICLQFRKYFDYDYQRQDAGNSFALGLGELMPLLTNVQ